MKAASVISARRLHIWNAISLCDSREVTARDTLSLAISVVFG